MAVQISGNDITVPRDGSFTRNVTIGGTLTYEDVTNIDSVGLVTARSGIEVGARPGVGASISVDGNAIFSGITTATTLRTPTGIATHFTADKISFPDSSAGSINVGLGSDLQIYHNGSHSYITNSGSGNLYIDGDTDDLVLQAGDDVRIQTQGNENAINCIGDGAVELYHDNSKKLETASGGVTVTGTVAATSFTGSGAALTGISAGITELDHWYLTSNKTSNGDITANLLRANQTGATIIGNGMSESSGIFTFPSTGKYLIIFTGTFVSVGNDSVRMRLAVTTNNSSYTEVSQCIGGQSHYSGGSAQSATASTNFYILDVTDTSNVKVKFVVGSIAGSSFLESGGSGSEIRTGFVFARIGDT